MTDVLNLTQAIEIVDALVPTAHQGLPDPLFYLTSRLTPMVNVDLVIRDQNKRILLTWRDDRFYGPGWHIPGGIIRFKETWSNRIHEVARCELGATISHDETPAAVFEMMNPDRDIRGHFISLVFECRLLSELAPQKAAQNLQQALPNEWIWAADMPTNILKQQRKFAKFFAANGG